MNVRRIPSAAPKRPASKTTLSRGEAWPDSEESDADWPRLVQSSRAKTNAAKSTSRASSRSRSSVVVPGLNDVVHGSTWATSSRPRVSACSSFCCCPDEPKKMRGFPMSGGNRRRRLRLGNRGHCSRHLLGLVFHRKIGLRHDADHSSVAIDNGDAPDLTFLHQPFAMIQGLALAAGDWIRADECLDGRALWIEPLGHHRATEIAVGDDADELAGCVVGHHGQRADIVFEQYARHVLRAVGREAANGGVRHGFSYDHRDTSYSSNGAFIRKSTVDRAL